MRGFTLVELAVVMAIVGALAVMATGVGNEDRANTRGVADQLVSSLDEIRVKAQGSKRWHRVIVDGTSTRIEQSTSTGMVIPTAWELIGATNLTKGIRVAGATAGAAVAPGNTVTEGDGLPAVLVFKPDGSCSGGTLFLSDRGNQTLMRIALFPATGYARVFKGW